MLFGRAQKQKFGQKVRESVWPSMGWDRTVRYYRHRIFRTTDSPYHITAGLAMGAAVSFTPLLGTHFLQAVFLAWVCRINILAAIVGTIFGNPWTFPVLFWIDYKVGHFLFSMFGSRELVDLPATLTWQHMVDHPLTLFVPLLIGGYVCFLLALPAIYGMLYYPVKTMQTAYREQRRNRIMERRAARGL